MKLEPSHLIPYLPYGLNMYNPRGRGAYNVHLKRRLKKVEVLTYESFELFLFLHRKPLLRPLSDLYKAITVDGQTFTPIYRLNKIRNMNKIEISDYLDTSFDLEISLETEDYSQNIDLYDGYKIVQKLHEWHFDTQSLIKKELAIDINTVEL